MIISFYSNYLTHHQIPFCNAMMEQKDVEFHFISTMPMEEERLSGGWSVEATCSYELKAYQSSQAEAEAMRLARDSDVILVGSAPERYVRERMRHGRSKVTLRYSERIYKGGYWRALSPRGLIKRFQSYFCYLNKPLYALCASAYTAGDFAILGSYLGRCYQWGYFPEVRQYEDIDTLIAEKQPASLLWAARLIDWKHPELPISLAKKLKDAGFHFRLNMIGNGEMEAELQALITKNDLQDCVKLLGVMSPEQVRAYMEKSQIFLFTSDRHEGWGAVLNEAMNSACAVVASNAIGSVPVMIREGKNGYMYQDGNENALFERVRCLLDSPGDCMAAGKAAYESMIQMWNPKVAAERLVETGKNLLQGEKLFYPSGICSKAQIILGKVKCHAYTDHI